MKIEFVRSGGFAGIRLARTFDTAALPADQSQNLAILVEGTDFFNLPEAVRPASVVPDSILYHITVTSGGRTRSIETTETTMPAELRPLLQYLTSLAKLRPAS